MQLSVIRSEVNSLKLNSAKKKTKGAKCLEFSKYHTCSSGLYCKLDHRYKSLPKVANYGGSELPLTDISTKFLAEVRIFLYHASVFSSCSIKLLDVTTKILKGFEYLLLEGEFQDGLFVVSTDCIFGKLENLIQAQEDRFRRIQGKPVIEEGADFYPEQSFADVCIDTCVENRGRLASLIELYRGTQRLNKDTLLRLNLQTHPDLVQSLNRQIDEYYGRVCESMVNAKANNLKIISQLSSCVSNYFKSDFFASIVPFGSAANQLGNIQYSDLDLSLTLMRYSPSGVGLMEVPIVSDNLSVHKGRKRVAVMTQPVPPGGFRMSHVLKEVRNALYRYSKQFQVKEVLSWARVPIIKLLHLQSKIEVDICIGNRLAVKNTDLLRQLAEFDTRAHKLMLTVKYWAATRKLNKARNGTLSSYGWVLLVIYYLQIVNVLPSFRITNRATLDVVGVQGVEFELLSLPADAPKNTDTAAELLIKFFAFYGIQNAGDCGVDNLLEFRSGYQVVSIRNSGGSDKKVLLKTNKAVLELMNRSKKDKQQIGGETEEDEEQEEEEGGSDSETDHEAGKADSVDDGANNDFMKEVDSDGEVVTPSTAATSEPPEKTPEELLQALDLWYKFTVQDPFEEHDLGRVIQNPDIFAVMISELGKAAKTLVSYAGLRGNACRDVLDALVGGRGPATSASETPDTPAVNPPQSGPIIAAGKGVASPGVSTGDKDSQFLPVAGSDVSAKKSVGDREAKRTPRKDRPKKEKPATAQSAKGSVPAPLSTPAAAGPDEVSDDVDLILLANAAPVNNKPRPNPRGNQNSNSVPPSISPKVVGDGPVAVSTPEKKGKMARPPNANKQKPVGTVGSIDSPVAQEPKNRDLGENAVSGHGGPTLADTPSSGPSHKKTRQRNKPAKKVDKIASTAPEPVADRTDSDLNAVSEQMGGLALQNEKKKFNPRKSKPARVVESVETTPGNGSASAAADKDGISAVIAAVQAPLKSKRPPAKKTNGSNDKLEVKGDVLK